MASSFKFSIFASTFLSYLYFSHGILNEPFLSSELRVRSSHKIFPGTKTLKEGLGIQKSHHLAIRGGETSNESSGDDDDERYSRQLYTLGARAHKLVRSTNVVLDGPFSSGLTYECCKNLALSGVGVITLVQDDVQGSNGSDDKENAEKKQRLKFLHSIYHNEDLDDLGNAYQNAAKNEISLEISAKELLESKKHSEETDYQEFLLLEYLKRLNPSLKISVMKRSQLDEIFDVNEKSQFFGENPVYLCVDRPQSTQLAMNSVCRNLRIPFVSVESRGVYGRAFCDFGDNFFVVDEDGESPKNTLFERLELLDQSEKDEDIVIEVHCVEGEKHEVSKGDIISFDLGDDGMSAKLQLRVLKVKSPTLFTVTLKVKSDNDKLATFIEQCNQSNQSKTFSRIKIPRHFPFLSMEEALQSCLKKEFDLFAASDLDKSFDETRRAALTTSFTALDEFTKRFNRLPKKRYTHGKEDEDDISQFKSIIKSIDVNFDIESNESKWKSIVESFVQSSAASLVPVQALMGALGAQETLKAASGLYNPIQQFLLYDCDEILYESEKISGDTSVEEIEASDHTAPGQTYILGPMTTSNLASQRLFVVGSGAIGCEILKNLSAMGAATSGNGCIFLTDMDTIERSNLSRQLLFRDADVGKFKSSAAETAVKRFNEKLNIEAHSAKVGEDASGPFDESFWSKKIDVVLNALDNVEARLFIDKKCVENRKGMIDAGTLGSKGNMQVVVPMKSESYGSSVDPPEPAIPVCTLKNFPYEISHTIQWGRDLFDGLFNRRPGQANAYWESSQKMEVEDLAQGMLEKLGEDATLTAAEEIREDLWSDLNGFDGDEESEKMYIRKVKEASFNWAIKLVEKLFQISIIELLRQHPENSLDEDGVPFWSGTRRCPKLLSVNGHFDETADPSQISFNEHLVDFIQSATRLRMETYLPEKLHSSCIISKTEAKSILETVTKESEEKESGDDEATVLSKTISMLKQAVTNSDHAPNLQVTEFEKDDESNDHVTFVTAASNLRAIIYSIPPTSKMETRRIAGRIVPAMITTTALVSALSCIEMLKLIKKYPLDLHRNAFVNLALPFFAFTQPLPADEFRGLNGDSYTLWDRIVIREKKNHVQKSEENADEPGGITMRQLLKILKKKLGDGNEVTTISYGPYMIYANFLHEDDVAVLDQSIWELVRETIISGDDIDEVEFDEGMTDEFDDVDGNSFRNVEKDLTDVQMNNVLELEEKTFLEFSVVAEEEDTGEEVEIPPVRIMKWRQK